MAKIYRRKRRHIGFEGFCTICFVVAIILTFFANIFLRTANAARMMKIQDIQAEANVLRQSNSELTIQIQSLQNKERIYTFAQEEGMSQNEANVINLPGE